MDDNLVLENNSKKFPVLPSIFLILVIVLSIGLFSYNKYLQSGNEKISSEISQIETNIENLRKDPKIKVYELLEKYKTEIARLENNSNVIKFIDHLADIRSKYWVSFSGFALANWEIKTEAEARKLSSSVSSKDTSYEKVAKFIKEYREDKNKEALFDLDFVNSFEWMDTIKFGLNFKIKAPKAKKEEIKSVKQNTTTKEKTDTTDTKNSKKSTLPSKTKTNE